MKKLLAVLILGMMPALAIAIPITSMPSDTSSEPGTPFRHNLFHDASIGSGANGNILAWFTLDTTQASDWNPATGALTLYIDIFDDETFTNQVGTGIATSTNLLGSGFGDFDNSSLGTIDWSFYDLLNNLTDTITMEFFDRTYAGDSDGNIPNTYVNNTVTLWGMGTLDSGDSLGVDMVFVVPEPSILMLMALGLLGFGVTLRRR